MLGVFFVFLFSRSVLFFFLFYQEEFGSFIFFFVQEVVFSLSFPFLFVFKMGCCHAVPENSLAVIERLGAFKELSTAGLLLLLLMFLLLMSVWYWIGSELCV